MSTTKKNSEQLSPSRQFYYGLLENEFTSSDEEDLASIPISVEQQKSACIISKCYVQLNNRNLFKKLEKKVIKKFPKIVGRENNFQNKLILRVLNSKSADYYFPTYDEWEKSYEEKKRRIWRLNKIKLLTYFEKKNRSDGLLSSESNNPPLSTLSFNTQELENYSGSEVTKFDSSQVLFDFIEESEEIASTQGESYRNFNQDLHERSVLSSQPTTSTQKL